MAQWLVYYILAIDMVCHMAHPKGKVGTNRCYVELIDLHVLCLLGNKFVQQDDVKDFGRTRAEPTTRAT